MRRQQASRPEPRPTVREFIWAFAVWLLLLVALYAWLIIGAAVQP